MLPRLGPDMLLMADRGFPSYDLYVDTRPPEQTCSGVSRRPSPCPSSPACPTAPTSRNCAAKARNSGSPSASPEYSIRDDDGTSEVFALITNLLDPDDAPALELARNYSELWHIELLFRLVKVDLRTPGGILRSRSPQGVRQEIWALLCLYQALRTLITRTALIARLDATRISFPPALDAVKDSVGRAFSPS